MISFYFSIYTLTIFINKKKARNDFKRSHHITHHITSVFKIIKLIVLNALDKDIMPLNKAKQMIILNSVPLTRMK